MRKLFAVSVIVLIILSLAIAGCQTQLAADKPSILTGPTDQEILSEHPDDLDGALQDLTLVDES